MGKFFFTWRRICHIICVSTSIFHKKRVINYFIHSELEREREHKIDMQNPKVKEMTIQILHIVTILSQTKIIRKASSCTHYKKTHLPQSSLHDWTSKSIELLGISTKRNTIKYIVLLLNTHIPTGYKQISIYIIKVYVHVYV